MLDAIIMADLHFGAINVQRFKFELDRCLFDRLNHMKKLDMFIIAGDLFDMKEYSSSDTFKGVLNFLDKVIEFTKKMNTKIVIIKGTRTHDDYQLNTLEIIYQKCERMKFVHTVEEDEVDGVKFLYIPEEYVLDQELYYKEYFSKHYDIIIGHGTIDDIWRSKKQKRSDITSAPVFNADELLHVANYCYFGHEHVHKKYGANKRFTFVGPITCWEYDKKDHGYYIIRYGKRLGDCVETYITNDNAQSLVTHCISVHDGMQEPELVGLVDDALKKASTCDGLKLIIKVSEMNPIFKQARAYLISKIGMYENVKLSLDIQENNETEEEESNQLEEELHNKVFSDGMSDEQVIAEHIKTKNGRNISLDKIRDICGIKEDSEC